MAAKTLQVQIQVDMPASVESDGSLRRLYEQIHSTTSALVCAFKHQRPQEEMLKISTNVDTTNWV